MRELGALLRAPYALLHLETHEEERALDLIARLARRDERPVHTWSITRGFGDAPDNDNDTGGDADLARALARVATSPERGVYVFVDAAHLLENARLRRLLRETERSCARQGKTLIFVGPTPLDFPEFQKDLTPLSLPLPDREGIKKQLLAVFPPHHFPDLDSEALTAGALGLTQREAHRAFHRVRQQLLDAREERRTIDLEDAILQEKRRLVGRSEVLEFHPLDAGLDTVGGLDALKDWLVERRAAFGQEARAYGLPAPRGLLLLGVQGCGKSLSARVIGRHWGLPLLRLDMGRVFDGRRSPEESLRTALKTCDALAPCVLWIDEIEKGFARGPGDEGRSSRVLGSLLTWQQERQTPVFVVATANSVTDLPPEMLRKGRFDEIFFVDLPQPHERQEILSIHLARRGRAIEPETIAEVAELCEHFSGAELEQVVISAMYSAFAGGRELDRDDLVYAARDTVPLYRTYEESIKGLREWAHQRARQASRTRRMLDFFTPG
ncbi:AAA family ATPase [Lujinxingia litoralis]|uniref:Uncharacterized AAA domain-containing protein ycf46 n=2 Tax=Lujinxingia litoralis TaxID=2211119 RepID=A0A328C3Z9_9DELT|nr:AAA family ATPase [Lujinxingia litoralis]